VVGGGVAFFATWKERRLESAALSRPAGTVVSNVVESVNHFEITDTAKPDYQDRDQYLAAYTPRIEGLPFTAPIYDDLQKPKTVPKMLCVIRESSGFCYCKTEQMTTIDISVDMCHQIVKNGIYNPSLNTQTASR